MDSHTFCNVCNKGYPPFTPLFSNRPLHKGKDVTLLICHKCIKKLDPDDFVLRSDAQCHWCGHSNRFMVELSGFRICAHCVKTCRSLKNQS